MAPLGGAVLCGDESVTSATFPRFLLVGVANTSVGYLAILIAHYGFGFSPITSNVLGYAIGTLISYSLNRSYTFSSTRPHAVVLPRFILSVLVSFGVNLAVLHVCLDNFIMPVAFMQAIAVVAYTITFYILSRYIVFRR